MSTIQIIDAAFASESNSHSRIVDLRFVEIDGGTRLFSTTRYDGVLQEWNLHDGSISTGDSQPFQGPLILGGDADFTAINLGSSVGILTGGAASGDLQIVMLNANGMGGSTALTNLPSDFDSLQNTTTIQTADGNQTVYGSMASANGIATLQFSASGALVDHSIQYDATGETTAGIVDSDSVSVGGQAFFITASGVQNGITSRKIETNGTLSDAHTIGVDDGLWISAPTAMGTATISGRTYIVLGAAGSDSLSVIEIGSDGSMVMRDHLLDDRDTRFGGVTTLEIVESDGRVYVIAGGADDGVSVLMLLDGGMLIHRAHIEDTVDITLDNVSAIAAQGGSGGIDIFVASGSEAGVTQLRYDTGPIGVSLTAADGGGALTGSAGQDMLHGQAGADMITAGDGDDILRDGAGSDILSGGAGADLFILSGDGVDDTITDFTLGEDMLDLSLWPMLRDISQLFIATTENGMRITYGDETLFVQSANGEPIDYRLLTNADLIGGSRLPVDLVPGFAGPATPPPNLNGPQTPPTDQGDANDSMTALQKIALDNAGLLSNTLGSGGMEPVQGRVLTGSDQAETLSGASGNDLIFAGDGNDGVDGSGGNDTLFGRGGDDLLAGGDGADTLFGGTGDDTLIGGFGHDLLIGGSGADNFVFNAGNDIISDFALGTDHITLDARLWTGLTSAEDLLLFYAEVTDDSTTINFDTGDTLTLMGVTDLDALADDVFLF